MRYCMATENIVAANEIIEFISTTLVITTTNVRFH